jgi:hypothetical protein
MFSSVISKSGTQDSFEEEAVFLLEPDLCPPGAFLLTLLDALVVELDDGTDLPVMIYTKRVRTSREQAVGGLGCKESQPWELYYISIQNFPTL